MEKEINIKKLESEIERLKDRVLILEDKVITMTHSKLANPEQPFFEWLVQWDVFGEKKVCNFIG